MAELFATMMASLGGGTAAAAGTTAAAGAGAAAAGAGGALGGIGLGTLSTGLTVVGGISSVLSGFAQKRAMESQAIQEETAAVQETIQGRQDALDSLRALNRDQAQIAVAGFSSGIGSEGSVAAAQEKAQTIGQGNIEMSRTGASIRSAGRRQSAAQARIEGTGAVLGGIAGAVSGVSSLFQRRQARG